MTLDRTHLAPGFTLRLPPSAYGYDEQRLRVDLETGVMTGTSVSTSTP